MESIYMILAAAVLIVAIAFKWGYNRGTQEKSIEAKKAKEKEMKDQKEAILADIRDKAADVAEEQGIDIIFSEYEGIGTALDVTDDIIVKLA